MGSWSFKRHMGLDVIDAGIHAAVTIFAAVMVSTQSYGPDEGAVVAFVFLVSAVVFGVRRRRALQEQARQPETTGEAAAYQMQELEARVAELEQGQQRMLELEERLDFAERLLAQRVEPLRMEGPE